MTASSILFVLSAIFAIAIFATSTAFFAKTHPNVTLAEYQKHLIELYKKFHAITEEYNVKVWAAFGSLLGARRHGTIIPWDDDCDMEIWETDRQILLKHEAAIRKKYGISFSNNVLWNVVGTLKVQYLSTDIRPAPFIDVFPVEYRKNKTHLASRFMRYIDPTCYHTGKLTEFEYVPFADTRILAPKSDILENCYGKNWRTPIKRFSHYFWIDGQMPLFMRVYLGVGGALLVIPVTLAIVAAVLKNHG